MLKLFLLLAVGCICLKSSYCDFIDPSDLTIFVIGPGHSTYHSRRNQLFRNSIYGQVKSSQKNPNVIFVYGFQKSAHNFVYASILHHHQLALKYQKWIVFCQEETRFDLAILTKYLSTYESSDSHLLGYGLVDSDMTITHHFATPRDLTYPDVAAGMTLSNALVSKIIGSLDSKLLDTFSFQIDVNFEFAKYIKETSGVNLEHVEGFCNNRRKPHCFTWITEHGIIPSCDKPVDRDQVVFAVKTYSGHFKDRIPIIKATWANLTKHIRYYADVDDDSVPSIETGVPNTERGHCAKLLSILHHVAHDPDLNSRQFLVIADDDTLISVPRLLSLLACYLDDAKLALGERYGYLTLQGAGYDYITGGGGVVLSMAIVRQLTAPENSEQVVCSNADDPDDMRLGMWLQDLGIPITHSHLFHQARSNDYPEALLSRQLPISFHKFWECDPIAVYHRWLSGEEKRPIKKHLNDEL